MVKSVEINRFRYEDKIAAKGFHYLSIEAKTNGDEKSNDVLLMAKQDRPLTIEGMTGLSKGVCSQPGFDSLYWANCQGNIRIIAH